MQKYQNNIADRSGNAVGGIAVTITLQAGGGLATIYSDNTGTVAPNPLTTDANGYFEFYAADGRYNIDAPGGGYHDVLIADTVELAAVTLKKSEAAASDGATKVGTPEGTVQAALDARVKGAALQPRPVGDPLFVETTIGTIGIPAVPNNANAYSTGGADVGEGGLTVNITAGAVGATALTSSDTSIVAGFGNIVWPCAIEFSDGTHAFNVVTGDNGSTTINLRFPIKKSAVGAKLSCKYDSAQGQHLTKRATRAWAEHIYAQREVDCVGSSYLNGVWVDQQPKYQTLIKPNAALIAYGALTVNSVLTTLINEVSGLTPYDADWYLLRPIAQASGIRVGAHLVGHGATSETNVSGVNGVFEVFAGEEKATGGSNGITLTISGVVNGVEQVLYQQTTVRSCIRAVVPFIGFDLLRMSCVANVDGTRYIRVGEARVWVSKASNRRAINKDGRYLLMGDSWTAFYNGEFGRWLQVCMRRDGGIGSVTTKGMSGTTSKYGLDWFDSRAAGMDITDVMLHFYTNDANSAGNPALVYNFLNPAGVMTDYRIASMTEWRSLMMAMVQKAAALGCRTIMCRPGGTASAAQTQIQLLWGRQIAPGVCVDQQRQALADELADPLAAVNVTGKVRGSKVFIGDTQVFASGGGAAAPWIDSTGTRIGRLESLVFDFFPSLRGTYTIGKDSDADGLSDGVTITSYNNTTNISVVNSIVAGKQKSAITYGAGFGAGGFRQRYQYPALAGHKYLIICKLSGSTASRAIDRIYDNAAGGNVAPAASTDASGNSLTYFSLTQTAAATRNFYVNLSSPATPMTLETVTEAVYVIDLTDVDARLGTSFSSMTDADAFGVIYPALTRLPPTGVRLTDTVTGLPKTLSIASGAVAVT